MKHLLIIVAVVATAFAAAAAKPYGIGDVPNVHLADSTRFVSNPDGILSERGRARADSLLHRLAIHTGAEVVAVVVDDIDPNSDIDDFATDLFRAWGLGKKDTNNGGLLLVAANRRKYVFRTGSGLEGLIPDGLAGSIMRREMRPRFRKGDYDGGIITTLSAISDILSSPEGAAEIRSKYANNSGSSNSEKPDLFKGYLVICLVAGAAMLLWVGATWMRTRGKTRYERYLAADKIYAPVLFATFAGLGIPLVALLPLMIWRHRLRRGTHKCHECGSTMQLVDEVNDNKYLTRAQDIEEQIGAVDYDVWLCPRCGETEVIPYIIRSSAYTQCPVCHARAMRTVSDRTVRRPTDTSTGLRVITRRCLNCGHEDDETRTLPKVVTPPVVILPGGIGGRGSGSSGGFGGGSFGGGFTAGGGASGGW